LTIPWKCPQWTTVDTEKLMTPLSYSTDEESDRHSRDKLQSPLSQPFEKGCVWSGGSKLFSRLFFIAVPFGKVLVGGDGMSPLQYNHLPLLVVEEDHRQSRVRSRRWPSPIVGHQHGPASAKSFR